MPELPEVETIVRELKPQIIGKKFWGVETRLPAVFLPSAQVVREHLRGLRVLDVTRRGKFLVLVLDKKMRLTIHLRMSGRLLWKNIPGREKYIRAHFSFTDGTSLFFSDVRKFGRIWLYPEKSYQKMTGIFRLGQEPLNPEFQLQDFLAIFSHKKGILKNTLLRQDILAGIGNIYADEICFQIRRHPSSRLENMAKTDLGKLFAAIRNCLEEGISHSGASVSDFVGTKGTLGQHQLYLKVYGRKGDPCYVCKSPIKKSVVAGRGTFFCSFCQRKA